MEVMGDFDINNISGVLGIKFNQGLFMKIMKGINKI